MSQNYFNLTQYYEWLANGLDEQIYLENEENWHDTEIRDLGTKRETMVKNFFCGKRPEDSIAVSTDYHGLIVPIKRDNFQTSYSRLINANKDSAPSIQIRNIEFSPYQVIRFPGVCNDEIKSLTTKKVEQVSYYEKVECPVSFDSNHKKYVVKKFIRKNYSVKITFTKYDTRF